MSYYAVPEGQSAGFSANEGGGVEGGRGEIPQQEEWNVDRMAGAGTGEGGTALTSGLERKHLSYTRILLTKTSNTTARDCVRPSVSKHMAHEVRWWKCKLVGKCRAVGVFRSR